MEETERDNRRDRERPSLTVVRRFHRLAERHRELPRRVRRVRHGLAAEDGVRKGKRGEGVKRQPLPGNGRHVGEVHQIPRASRSGQCVSYRSKSQVILLLLLLQHPFPLAFGFRAALRVLTAFAAAAASASASAHLRGVLREVESDAHAVAAVAPVHVTERVNAR